MRPHTMHPRNTGGFSLDDAARAYRSSQTMERVALCPHCRVAMIRVGDVSAGRTLILRCPDCGRGVVLQAPGGAGR